MSVGIYDEYAVLWFGHTTDPQGIVPACNAAQGAFTNKD